MNILPKILLFIGVTINFVGAQDSSRCIVQESCDKCLLADVTCAWCTDRDYGMTRPRCLSQSEMHKSECRKEFVLFTEPHPAVLVDNEEIRDFSKGSMDAVQIQPQKVNLILQKGQTQRVTLKYKPAQNFPVDLYFLMDVTHTMKDDLERLHNLGQELTDALQKMTENYRVAFGSFVDKPILPYINPLGQENPCSMLGEVCEPTFDFHHHLSLTSNVTKFVNKIRTVRNSANLDDLEGGFDALMQVLVCDKIIGWSEQSRKIVLYVSDGDIHFAGDGLMAGIIRRNDKQCRLNAEGMYTGEFDYDYPSVEEIYHVLLQTKINVIFAVPGNVTNVYDQLHLLMQENTRVGGQLAQDSSNIIELIEKGYKEFANRVHFFDNSPDYITVEYETTCNGQYRQPKKTSKCDNVEIGEEYDFNVKITLTDFPEDPNDYHQLIKIEETFLSSENLEIEIEIKKPCTCLQTDEGEKSSALCSGKGEFKCGSCHCDDGWIGQTCNCDLQDFSTNFELQKMCHEPVVGNSTDFNDDGFSDICSNRGECVCGNCFCNRGFDGKFCECPECPSDNGMICGGNLRSTCVCGECQCATGWSGPACSCTDSTDLCMPPNDDKICSGNGECECGECSCDRSYYGQFCESRSGSDEGGLCSYYEPCIRCRILRKLNQKCDNISELCRNSDGEEFLSDFFNDVGGSNSTCIVRTENVEDNMICQHKFSYEIDDSRASKIRIVLDPCKPVRYALFGITVMICTLLLGIFIILLVKMRNVVVDRREFAKFEEDQKKTEYHMNQSPLYKPATKSYQVPPEFFNTTNEI